MLTAKTKKAPSYIFDWVLNIPLIPVEFLKYCDYSEVSCFHQKAYWSVKLSFWVRFGTFSADRSNIDNKTKNENNCDRNGNINFSGRHHIRIEFVLECQSCKCSSLYTFLFSYLSDDKFWLDIVLQLLNDTVSVYFK